MQGRIVSSGELERQAIGDFDPVYSQDFFQKPKGVESLDVVVSRFNYPLPESPETLQEFFNSPLGVEYKAGFKQLLNKLTALCKAFKIEFRTGNHVYKGEVAVAAFTDNFYDYDAHDAGLNQNYFALYTQGLPVLHRVLELIEDNSIDKSVREACLHEMIQGFYVCAPGVHTHITDCYDRLMAVKNVASEYMTFRKSIARAIVQDDFNKPVSSERPQTKLKHYIQAGNEIHYVNGVLNRYEEMLGLLQLEDEFVKACNQYVLTELCGHFKKRIGTELRVEKLFDTIIDSLAVDEWVAKLKNSMANGEYGLFNELVSDFNKKLNHYGDAEVKTDELVALSDDGTKVIDKSYQWHYTLYHTLLERMIRSGFINNVAFDKPLSVEGVDVYVLPKRTLKLSFVYENKQFHSLLPYLAQSIAAGNEFGQHGKLWFLKDKNRYKEMRDFLVPFISQQVDHDEAVVTQGSRNSLSFLVDITQMHFEEIYTALDDKLKSYYLKEYLLRNIKVESVLLNSLVSQINRYAHIKGFEKAAVIIDAIIHTEIRPSRVDHDGNLALHLAAESGHYSILSAVLQSRGSYTTINSKNKEGKTALMLACESGSQALVNEILKKIPDVNQVCHKGYNALFYAARLGKMEVVAELIKQKSNVKLVADEDGNTLLHMAAYGGNNELMAHLLNLVPDMLDLENYDGKTPLMIALDKHDNEVAKLLMDKGAKFEQTKENLNKLLDVFCRPGHLNRHTFDIIKMVLDCYLKLSSQKVNSRLYYKNKCKGEGGKLSLNRLFDKNKSRYAKGMIAMRLNEIVDSVNDGQSIARNQQEADMLKQAIASSRFLRKIIKCMEGYAELINIDKQPELSEDLPGNNI